MWGNDHVIKTVNGLSCLCFWLSRIKISCMGCSYVLLYVNLPDSYGKDRPPLPFGVWGVWTMQW